MEFSNEVMQRLELLKAKFDAQGQDLLPYLDGLLYAKTITDEVNDHVFDKQSR